MEASPESQPKTPPQVPNSASAASGAGDEKIWIILSHISLLLGVGFVVPLVVYLVKKQDHPLTAQHAKEALNFHISVYLYGIISGLLCLVLIGIPMLVALAIGSVVCSILACVKASDGEFYRYPLTIRLV